MKTYIFLFQSDISPCITGLVIIAIIIIISMIVSHQNNKRRNEALDEAESKYRNLLAQLKKNPTSADLRQRSLAAGRSYSNLTRDTKGVTIYDEMALMNDINAACAAAGVSQATNFHQPIKNELLRIEERLQKLESLKNNNLISQTEYETRRAKIIDEI